MRPAIAERNAAETRPIGPDRTQPVQHGFQDDDRRQRPARRTPAERIEQTARPRRVAEREKVGTTLECRTETPQQLRASRRPRQRLHRGGLKRRLERRGLEPAQQPGIDAQWIIRILGKCTAREPSQAREGQALGATGHQPCRRVPVLPTRTRTRIEQDRGHGQIDRGPGRSGRTRPTPRGESLAPQIPSRKYEMAPARVQRRIEPRVPLAHHTGHEIRGGRQLRGIDAPIVENTRLGEAEHALRAGAYGGCRQQTPRRLRLRRSAATGISSP